MNTEESPFTGFVVGRWYRDAAGNVGRWDGYVGEWDGQYCDMKRGYGEWPADKIGLYEEGCYLFDESGAPTGHWPHPIVAEVPAPQAQEVTPQQDKWLHDAVKKSGTKVADGKMADPNAAMLARDKPLLQFKAQRTPFDPLKGWVYDLVSSGSTPPAPSSGKFASPDLTPMGHQVAPHWAKDHS